MSRADISVPTRPLSVPTDVDRPTRGPQRPRARAFPVVAYPFDRSNPTHSYAPGYVGLLNRLNRVPLGERR